MYKTDPLAPANSVLRENDVVIEMDGTVIADGALGSACAFVSAAWSQAELRQVMRCADATVEFRNEERVEFSHIVRSKHIGMPMAPLLMVACSRNAGFLLPCPACSRQATATRSCLKTVWLHR